MNNPRLLGLLTLTVCAVLVPVGTSAQAAKESDSHELTRHSHECSVATVAGSWVFKTDGLYLPSGELAGNVLGVVRIHADGTLHGKYDFQGPSGFFPAIEIEGTVIVNPDCTGTLSFHQVDTDDSDSTQSIAIGSGGKEILGMFQDPTGDIGTYRAIRMNEDD
jgi:hypothetical protein